jgi:predicted nucleic acid-binding protein
MPDRPDRVTPRAVIDSNIVFEGLTRSSGAAGVAIEAWVAGLYRGCVTNALAYEYAQALSTRLSPRRWDIVRPALTALLSQAQYVTVHYRWRPMSPDPADDHVIDCAMNAGAPVVTANVRDFRVAEQQLGLRVMTAVEFVEWLTAQLQGDT